MTVDDYLNGQVLLIDKPIEWTSFQAVNKIRWHIKQKYGLKKIKVGHAGTLDPLATGLLIICTGKETKNIATYQGQIKEYTGTFTLGATTPSYDLETTINETFATDHITNEVLTKAAKNFLGEIDQKPPIFSAIKKDGKRLYELARKGETTEIASRKVSIFEFELTKTTLPEVNFRVVCSKGTYIRSLAYDFGLSVNSGAHLSSLRRTKIGEFSVKNALSINQFIEKLELE
ncbi:MAG: tRNA pseudouridine(55) synthase TruB [Gammaproteobacteria bacterium]|nr:tRNA pseudouridine(55) synthase TruB [Gammaproteobacteria bacterium]MDG1509081.1 tRNA pseudouridine(55) synthase TruB [Flavobacteriaceae bacterium]MDG2274938.1 tRNA pseudouridine(55) synthase TruB [Flavobacteriaceae bacterium]